MQDRSVTDYHDLNLIYLTTVGTWKHGIEAKKRTISESHLIPEDKDYLKELWDEIWVKAVNGDYSNSYAEGGNPSVGMFGTGFFSFQNKTTTIHVHEFISMCIDLLSIEDDNTMYDRASQVLTASFKGMAAASASMVLHCLKPYTFPIMNSNMGNENIFLVLGIPLKKSGNIESYIDNCRMIKEYRDLHFSFRNYRIFDMAAWNVKNYMISNKTDEDNVGKRRTWLLTWNREKWNWDEYSEKCQETKAGKAVVDSWTCSSVSPQIGDDIFLIKLGAQPRGIIGHGNVIKESYKKEHFDAAKAAEGKTGKYINVVFDRLLDYQKDRIITQDELNQNCSAQYWSPQNSGIEIKPEVLPVLHTMWKTVTGDHELFGFMYLILYQILVFCKHIIGIMGWNSRKSFSPERGFSALPGYFYKTY